jgi:hypothetical protein
MEALLSNLVGVATKVVRTETPDPERDATGAFAEFVTADGALAVVAFADVSLVNHLGGLMLGMDPEALGDATAKRFVLDEALEGFQEVANVFTSCLNTDFTPHLRLGAVVKVPAPLTDETKALWREPRGRRAYGVSVDEHASGVTILYLA